MTKQEVNDDIKRIVARKNYEDMLQRRRNKIKKIREDRARRIYGY